MGDLVAFTEFGHGAFLQLVLKDKAKFFFHNTARFPWHALVLHAIAKVLQCQGCSRSILSGMCPVRTPSAWTPLPLCFSQVLILKVVKVLCFDTLLQVLILKVVSWGRMRCRLEASLSPNRQS